MKNPYKKTKDDEDWGNAQCVPRHLKLKWLWFHHNKTLWMSNQRISRLTESHRDYILPILERYVRRFGYANEAFFRMAYQRIEEKRLIGSRKTREYPDMNKYGEVPDGDYCAVDFENPDRECPFCGGSEGYLLRPVVIDQYDRDFRYFRATNDKGREYHLYPGAYSWNHGVKFHCLNRHCIDVMGFINGNHHLFEKAREIGVKRNLPVKKIKSAKTIGEAFLLSTAAMLDFEARYEERK
jgi:hypothetical protein